MSDGRSNFPKMEEEILKFWEAEKIFEKTLSKDSPQGEFVFYEGPPTANGKPGIHHVEARAFKDIIPRYKTMCGYHVGRKGGWDTQGLPVELEVEKQLGLSCRKEVEEYGIKEYNEKCKESVWKYLDQWIGMTKRIAYWLDIDNAYITYKPEYIESLWWIIKQVWERDLLYQDYKVLPYCTRCGTSLSSHEVAQGYKEVEDPAVYIKFKVKDHADTFLVAWTTTPWTLISNTALAVGQDVDYVKVKQGNEFLWLARSRAEAALGADFEIIEEVKGSELLGVEYEPLFPYWEEARQAAGIEGKAHYVVAADFVSTEDGSGIVHTAVMYGAEDFELGNEIGLPKFHMIAPDGKFIEGSGPFTRVYVKKADAGITEDLRTRGLLLKEEKITHTYPFCWRCKSPLIYYAMDSWYIRMSSLRDKLLTENDKIHWEPDHIKDGRFGEWLREVKDWAFSRSRYWGTPLPVWCCECGHMDCIGSYEELKDKAKQDLDLENFDPHRPFVDDYTIECPKCQKEMRRVEDVCDVWFDSGCMPFAQWHYPFENKELIDSGQQFPGDYISEAIDQTRGWFYTLHAVGILLDKGLVYKNCICLGHLLDSKGKKMSKSIGNVVEPMEQIDKYGADALRWWMYTVNQPGESKNYDERDIDTIVKKLFNILWNVKTFYQMYEQKYGVSDRNDTRKCVNILDQWILSRLNSLIADSTKWLDGYKITEPARAIADFVTDLSTWYVRRSRDRFKSENEQVRTEAMVTLRHCLIEVTKLMAPFTPFISEDIYRQIGGEKQSVHLEDWPVADEKLINQDLLDQMDQVRRVVSEALKQREEKQLAVKQPLAKATVRGMKALDDSLLELIKDEVNIKEVVFATAGDFAVELDTELTPELKREGYVREIVRKVNGLRKEAGLTIEDSIELYVVSDAEQVQLTLQEHQEAILSGTLAKELKTEKTNLEHSTDLKLGDEPVWIAIKKM
ncbi:MAG: isoleucine--tRNA ligase [Candidatus Uhrbacteria bacterium]